MNRIFVLACGIALLSGCSGSILPESKKIDYKSTAKKLPSLEVPPDLTKPSRDERYAVPDMPTDGSTTFSEYAGGQARSRDNEGKQSGVLPSFDQARIERAGSQRWLVVQGSPERLWPEIKAFWQELGFIINIERPEAGIMETDWAENRANIKEDFIRSTIGKVFDSLYSTPERDKFRTRLEPGSTQDTTEIYISHRGMNEVYIDEGKSQTRWQAKPADPELEAEMLRRLMLRFGVAAERAEQILEAKPSGERARLSRGEQSSGELTLFESFDRAWRRVGLTLDRVGFTVEDRNRSEGIYFVRYVDPEAQQQEEKSWLSKLAFWRSDEDDKPKHDSQYRINVSGAQDESQVRILTANGEADNSATARKILNLLYEQLR